MLISKVRRRVLWNDEAAPRNRNDIPRRAILATLVLAGVRIYELCGLTGDDVDLASGRIRVRRAVTRTDAGERVIPMVPSLREALVDHRATYPYGGADLVFGTRTGSRNSPDNIRSRIVAGAHLRANERLSERSRPQIGHLTPHTLRRTFASLLAETGVSPRRAMYLLGHTDPKLTMGVYQHVLDLSAEGEQTLTRVLGGDVSEIGSMLSGRSPRPTQKASFRHSNKHLRRSKRSRLRVRGRFRMLKGPRLRAFHEERMKGLEPSTFCMARNGHVTLHDRGSPAKSRFLLRLSSGVLVLFRTIRPRLSEPFRNTIVRCPASAFLTSQTALRLDAGRCRRAATRQRGSFQPARRGQLLTGLDTARGTGLEPLQPLPTHHRHRGQNDLAAWPNPRRARALRRTDAER